MSEWMNEWSLFRGKKKRRRRKKERNKETCDERLSGLFTRRIPKSVLNIENFHLNLSILKFQSRFPAYLPWRWKTAWKTKGVTNLLWAPSMSLSRLSKASILERATMPPQELLESHGNGDSSGATAYFNRKSISCGSTLPSFWSTYHQTRIRVSAIFSISIDFRENNRRIRASISKTS